MRFTMVWLFVVGLATSSPSFAIERLTEKLTSADWQAALPEIQGLDEQTKQKVARELCEVMTSGYADAKLRATLALPRFGKAAVAPLLDLVRANPQVRMSAINALGTIGPAASEAVPQLIAIMQSDADNYARREAALALGKINPDARVVQPAYVRALGDSDAQVRRWAVAGLANLRPPATSAVADLTRLASSDPSRDTRLAALEAVSSISPSSAGTVSTMRKALADAESLVKGAAARALARAGPSAADAVGDLAALASRDPDNSVRDYTVRALGAIGPKARPAVPSILAALRSPDSHARVTAAQALSEIVPDDRSSADALVLALSDSDAYVRRWSIRALGAMGAPAQVAIPALVAKARGQNPEERGLAISALGRLGPLEPGRVVPVLLAIIEQGELNSRSAALGALSQFQPLPESAIPVLMKQLALDETLGANLVAAPVLAKAGRRALPPLIDALQAPQEPLRYGAAVTLKYMGASAREAVPALRKAQSDASERVRQEATEALAATR